MIHQKQNKNSSVPMKILSLSIHQDYKSLKCLKLNPNLKRKFKKHKNKNKNKNLKSNKNKPYNQMDLNNSNNKNRYSNKIKKIFLMIRQFKI